LHGVGVTRVVDFRKSLVEMVQKVRQTVESIFG